jgi:peptidyl-prolyl cis-trans isomerase D
MQGVEFDYQSALQMGLVAQIVENMASRVLLDVRAGKVGLAASDDRVYDLIQGLPQFGDGQGNFSPEMFAAVLEANGLAERVFVRNVADGIVRELLTGAMSAGLSGDFVAEAKWRLERESRVIDLITIDERAGLVPAPSDEDLRALYEESAGEFSEPEYRRLSYVLISPADAARVKKKASLDRAASYRAMVEIAENMIDEVSGGASLAEAAAAFGVKSARVVEVSAEGLSRDAKKISDPHMTRKNLDIAFFALDEGETSDALDAGEGVLLMRADRVFPARPKAFEKVRADLVKSWEGRQRRQIVSVKIDRLGIMLADGRPAAEAVLAVDGSARFEPNVRIGRNGGPGVPSALALMAFEASEGGRFTLGNQIGVVRKITLGSLEKGAEWEKFREREAKNFAMSVIDDYVKWLARKYKVENNLILN